MRKLIMWLLSIGMYFSVVACAKSNDVGSGNSVSESSVEVSSEISTESSTLGNSSESSALESSSQVEQERVTVTFRQSGYSDIVKTVEKGEALTDIPTPQKKVGYTVKWERVDFTNITEDITVDAIETIKTCTITLDAKGGYIAQTKITLTYGETYDFTTPVHEEKAFVSWSYDGQKIPTQGTWLIDVEESTLTVVALWEPVWSGNY